MGNSTSCQSPRLKIGYPISYDSQRADIHLRRYRDQKKILTLDPVSQEHEWDCGLACVRMAVGFAKNTTPPNLPRILDVLQNNKYESKRLDFRSLWTIELSDLLNKFGVANKFYTTLADVNEDYKGDTFYADFFMDDKKRISSMFNEAKERNLDITVKKLHLNDIRYFIASGHIVIMLVNARIIHKDRLELPPPASEAANYMGHYIIICGFAEDNSSFFVVDPCPLLHGKVLEIKSDDLEVARSDFGTDADALVCFRSTSSSVPRLSSRLMSRSTSTIPDISTLRLK